MTFDNNVLRYDEQAIMRLRTLYRQYGYSQYRMSRFEEYSLYSENKAFLASSEIITFTGGGGKLMALRPDVTLSIVKNTKDSGEMKKLYYNENVYRSDGHELKEQMQVGLECIGDLDIYSMAEVLMLARKSLEIPGESAGNNAVSCIDISHMGFINGVMQSENLNAEQSAEILKRVSEKNVPGLNAICEQLGLSDRFRERATTLAALYGSYDETFAGLRSLSDNKETDAALHEIESIYNVLRRLGTEQGINLDFSIVNDLNYYSGVIFQGYIEGVPTKVLSGGRYDTLLRKFGKSYGALGFAVYLDLLENLEPPRAGAEVDVLLQYDFDAVPELIADAVNSITATGQSVQARCGDPGDIKYKRIERL